MSFYGEIISDSVKFGHVYKQFPQDLGQGKRTATASKREVTAFFVVLPWLLVEKNKLPKI